MTPVEAMKLLDKTPLSSKKFIAYLLAELLSKGVLILMILRDIDWWAIIAMIIVTAFVEVGYILGQAALDRYVRVAQIFNAKKSPTTPH